MNDTNEIRPSRKQEADGLRISFEFFPPKNEEGDTALSEALERLAPLAPLFVSVTYGAGGSTRDRTLATLSRIVNDTGLSAAGHLTCVGASRDEIDRVVRAYQAAGVRHIVALRGDPQGGVGTRYEPHPDGYATTADLIKGIRALGDFDISVSAYPEKHPESTDFDQDLDVLQAKIDAGANRAITQFFFENALYYRYLDRALARGISIPIVPGILPVQNFLQTASFAMRTGATIPNWLAARFDGLDHDPATRRLVSVAIASEQVFDLLDHGVADFHFYTMNRAELTYAICHMLGLRKRDEKRAA
jgi:methylenetetrahydrofolate reductase (NADPH)